MLGYLSLISLAFVLVVWAVMNVTGSFLVDQRVAEELESADALALEVTAYVRTADADAVQIRQRFGGISRAEADTGGDAFGQIVDGDGRNKQQHLIELCRLLRMALLVRAAEPVQMGH